MRTIDPSQLSAEVSRLCTRAGQATERQAMTDVRAAGRQAASELRTVAPPKHISGDYAKGWASKASEDRIGPVSRVYNAAKPGLTHLLELGHGLWQGGWVNGIPHIKPAFEHAAADLRARLK